MLAGLPIPAERIPSYPSVEVVPDLVHRRVVEPGHHSAHDVPYGSLPTTRCCPHLNAKGSGKDGANKDEVLAEEEAAQLVLAEVGAGRSEFEDMLVDSGICESLEMRGQPLVASSPLRHLSHHFNRCVVP